jgi:iron complex outermembrane receptor protein
MLFAKEASKIAGRGTARCEPGGKITAARGFATRSILLGVGAVASAFGAVGVAQGDAVSMSTLQTLSIEDLLKIEITSVSKTGEPLSDAAAAVYVITREDIFNSGAKSLPDILRLAPNLQVAQITASTFAITARGFNGPLASKLLVLVDGRSVYTPLYSGVLWDVQEVLPEDIERIEVISGPGAALWGANAVNGVISITTRKTAGTLGGSLELGGGNLEQRGSLQYGDKLSDAVSYRAYIDSFHYGHDVTALGANAKDDWHKSQGGFRLDWTPSGDLMTLQGSFYDGSENKLTTPAQATSGRNVLARWNHTFTGGSGLQIQAYYDHTASTIPAVSGDYLDTYDLDVQHSFSWGTRQSIAWGGGFRVQQDDAPTVLSSTQVFRFSPQRRTLNLANIFAQDSISLSETLKLILGTKLEDDPYTGLEPLPSARLSWRVKDSDLLWAAVSRAVRAPSRIDRDIFEVVGPMVFLRGGDFQPEKLIAYELGYRAQPTARSSLSMATFYNVYTDLRSAELSAGGTLPVMFGNRMKGDTYGVEMWGNYQMSAWLRLAAGANWLHENLHFEAGSSGIGGVALAGNDPSYQVSVRSTMTLTRNWLLNLDLRHIGALPNPASPSYTELDAHIGWTASPSVEISLTGSNLIHPHHLEFGTTAAPLQLGATGVETGRSVIIDGRWRF